MKSNRVGEATLNTGQGRVAQIEPWPGVYVDRVTSLPSPQSTVSVSTSVTPACSMCPAGSYGVVNGVCPKLPMLSTGPVESTTTDFSVTVSRPCSVVTTETALKVPLPCQV